VAGGVEHVSQPFLREAPGEFDADDSLAEGQHLGVVRQDQALDGEGIVRDGGADSGSFVNGVLARILPKLSPELSESVEKKGKKSERKGKKEQKNSSFHIVLNKKD